MSLYIMKRKLQEKKNISSGQGPFSTMGVRRYLLLVNRYNLHRKCVKTEGQYL